MQTRIKLGYEQAKIIQDFRSMSLIMRQVMGPSTGSTSPSQRVVKNEAELRAGFRSVFGYNG